MKVAVEDLDHILAYARPAFEHLRGSRIFVTGGTGFFGTWLLESFAWANDRLGLNASMCVLTRAPEAFQQRMPHLAGHQCIQFHRGDIRSFGFPPGEFSYVIHAATESHVEMESEHPLAIFECNLAGTRRVLDFVQACGARRFLFTSSGAVYGKQPPEISHVPEDYAGAPLTTEAKSGYGEAKRAAEYMCAVCAERYGFVAAIARCFAFIGPHLPLDGGYAAGNFIRDAMAGGPIRISGDGSPYRSYLYAADLAVWLWTILCQGQSCRPYNVGSPEAISIAELAAEVARTASPEMKIHFARRALPGVPPERYVPSTTRAETELGLRPLISLPDAVRRTLLWCSCPRGGTISRVAGNQETRYVSH